MPPRDSTFPGRADPRRPITFRDNGHLDFAFAPARAIAYSGPMSTPSPQSGDTPAGFGFAVSAYLLWGFLPFYLKAVDHIPAVEVIAHRILWSVPIAGLVLIVLGSLLQSLSFAAVQKIKKTLPELRLRLASARPQEAHDRTTSPGVAEPDRSRPRSEPAAEASV